MFFAGFIRLCCLNYTAKVLAFYHVKKAFLMECMKYQMGCMKYFHTAHLVQFVVRLSPYSHTINDIFLYIFGSHVPDGTPAPSMPIYQPIALLPIR